MRIATVLLGYAHPVSKIPDWTRPLLACPSCQAPLETAGWTSTAVSCSACDCRVDLVDGVLETLVDEHPAVAGERQAVNALDAGEVSLGDPVGSEAAAAAFHAHIEGSRQRLQEVLAARPLEPGSIVVELGADACWASELFLDAGAKVIAVDISDHLRLATRGDDPNLLRMRADMNALPLVDGSVDVVWATAAAHHSWNLQNTFHEAARVLRRDGRGRLSFCCEPMPSWLRYPFGLWVGQEERELGINETWVPRAAWLRKARRAGFDARLDFPQIDNRFAAERLALRGVPKIVGKTLNPLLKPILPWLQVSIHLHGRLVAPAPR